MYEKSFRKRDTVGSKYRRLLAGSGEGVKEYVRVSEG
jgi:hypothetical protein